LRHPTAGWHDALGRGQWFQSSSTRPPGLLNGDDTAPPGGIVIFRKWNKNSVLSIAVEYMIYRQGRFVNGKNAHAVINLSY